MPMLPRVALRLAYDGSCFSGFQRQPKSRTVEGDLLRVLKCINAIRDPKSAHYRSSSRTDRGVSALGNVVSIDTAFDLSKLPRSINSNAEDLWCTGTAIIPDDLNVRYARSRTYACYLLDKDHDMSSMRRAAKSFLGTHDFSRYARVDNRYPERTIYRLEMERIGDLIEVIIEGNSFLWNQVRRMAWALDQVGKGYAKPAAIMPEKFALRRIGLIPAENLLLIAVDIGYDFELPSKLGKYPVEIGNRLISSFIKNKMFETMLETLSSCRSAV